MGRGKVNCLKEARGQFNILKLARGSWQGGTQGLGAICPCFSGRVGDEAYEGHKTSMNLNIGGCVDDHPTSAILSYMF